MVKVKLKIADVIIELQSKFPLESFTNEEERLQFAERFKNFFYNGRQSPEISIKVEIVDKLPWISKPKPVFITYHPQDGRENWCLLKKDNIYIYKCPLENKKQLVLVSNTFDKITAYLLPKKDKGWVWSVSDIIYDFLQILLINYFALNKEGIFIHSVGIKDLNGKGLLFAGKSGAGKTTSARLWHKHSKAMVLNDDRIIVRKNNGKFFIYGSPWHGDFRDYLATRIELARLEKVFFIYHSAKNVVKKIPEKEAFRLLYSALFPTFWDKECLEQIVSFCQEIVKGVPCYRLGFVNNQRVINFVREIE